MHADALAGDDKPTYAPDAAVALVFTMEPDPQIIYSDLSREITRDGVTIRISIFRIETDVEWHLEVINGAGGSTTWDKPFTTEEDALGEVIATIAKEGIQTFVFGKPPTVH